jgi:thiol-disulfide isomerase/thioredoxin
MRKCAPSVATSRRTRVAALATLALLIAGATSAADLRLVKDPSKVKSVFPPAAKIRVLNLWATWCAPCVAEMPDFRAIDAAFGREVALVGVSMDDMLTDAESAKVAAFLDKQKIGYPNVYYKGSPDALVKALNFDGALPATIVYDGKGKELWRVSGQIDRDETIARLREQLRRMQ